MPEEWLFQKRRDPGHSRCEPVKHFGHVGRVQLALSGSFMYKSRRVGFKERFVIRPAYNDGGASNAQMWIVPRGR